MRARIAMASLLVAACSGESVAQPPPPPVDWRALQARPPVIDAGPVKATDKERVAANTYIRALESPAPDFAQLGAALDENALFAFAGAKDTHGRDRVVVAHRDLFGAFDQRRFATSRVWLTDNSQAIEWTMTGVHAREWMTVAPTSKPVAIKGLTLLWTRDDGSISNLHVYFDVAAVKAQLGAGPKQLASLPMPQAPAAARQEFEQSGTPEEASNVAQVRAALDALEGGGEAAYLAAMTDDVEIYTLERAQPMHKDDAKTWFKATRKAIGQLDTTIDNAWGIGKFAVVEYFVSGEQLGPIGWIPAQRDTVVRMEVVDVAEMRQGRIARIWRFDNPGQILAR